MNFKRIICAVIATCMLAAGADALAQKRKATGRTTVAQKSGSASRAASGPTLDAAKLTDVEYFGFSNANFNGMWMFQDLTLEHDDITWNTGGSKFGGSWTVSGNALNVKSGGLELKMKSTDGGNYFTGKFINSSKGITQDSFLYRATCFTTPVDKAALTKRIIDGKYTPFASLFASDDNPELGVPAKFKMTPGDNANEGSYKLVFENEVLAALGTIRGTYKFDNEGLHLSQIDGSDNFVKYEDMNCCALNFNLGQKYIPDLGTGYIYLYLFFK